VNEKTNTKPFKWGIIGPGRIARKFAEAIPLAEGAKLQSVSSRDIERAENFAKKFGANSYHDNYEELAKDNEIDAVYVAVPHSLHAQVAIKCLENGKAVLVEKPMALNERQVQDMIDAAKKNNCLLIDGMWTGFLPVIQKTLELVRNGAIGEIKEIQADFGFKANYNPADRLFNMELGGGSVLDVGVYPLFLCQILLGYPKSIKANAQLSPTGVDEHCEAVLGYENAEAVIISSFVYDTARTAEIIGTKGRIIIPRDWYKADRLTLILEGEKEPKEFVFEPMINGFEYEIRELVKCKEMGLMESPMMTHDFSMKLARTMDTIRKQIGVKYEVE
jgi:predicted dehydrogenase